MTPSKSTRGNAKGKGTAEDGAPPPPAEEVPPVPMPAGEETPPLPEEAAPLPEEQPPMPDEAPPLPDEAPPLPDEAPPLPDEAPPLPDEAPPLPDEAPPLPDEAPPLPDEAPPLPGEAPPLPDEAPPLPNEAPPLPDEAPPLPNEAPPLPDEPAPGDEAKDGEQGESSSAPSHAWQAVWAPEKNAYYFWNTVSGEVTWENPLAPPSGAPSASATPSAAPSGAGTPGPSSSAPAARPGTIPDIDPELAYLLPAEARDEKGNALLASPGRFEQRNDGAFAALDEYARQKRFGEAYFDVEAYERERGKRRREEEAQPRKVTKKDMERFRAKKAEKMRRARAWLYD